MIDDKTYKTFTDLEVWKAAREYKNLIGTLVNAIPVSEKHRMADQILRSSRSVGSNIAEGYGRYTYKDQLHFCIQARGSSYEVMNHLIDAFDCQYISKDVLDIHTQKARDVEKLLNGYIAWLKKMNDSKNK